MLNKLILVSLSLYLLGCGSLKNIPLNNTQPGSCSVDNPFAGLEVWPEFPKAKYKPRPQDDGRPRLLSYGDSIPAGISRCFDPHGPEHYEFPQMIADTLNMQNNNWAPGDPRFDQASQFGKITTTQYRPTDIVLIVSFHNDLCEFGSDPRHLELSKTLLKAALTYIESFGAMAYVASPLNVACHNSTPYYADMVRDTMHAWTGASKLIDMNRLYIPNAAELTYDNVHPNYSGVVRESKIYLDCLQNGHCE